MIFLNKKNIFALFLSLFLAVNFSNAQSRKKNKKNSKTEAVKPKLPVKKKAALNLMIK